MHAISIFVAALRYAGVFTPRVFFFHPPPIYKAI